MGNSAAFFVPHADDNAVDPSCPRKGCDLRLRLSVHSACRASSQMRTEVLAAQGRIEGGFDAPRSEFRVASDASRARNDVLSVWVR